MNQKYLTLKTLRSLARFTETEQSRVSIPRLRPVLLSGLNPLLLLLTLFLLSSFTSFAWDDDDTDSKPFHQSRIQNQESRITHTSSIDYGYKNPYQSKIQHQESRITPTSTIDLGGPKRLAQAADDDDSKPFSQSTRERVPQPRGNIQNSANDYEATRARALHVDTIEEANDKRALRSEEFMAESQRSFERQEAQQEKSRAQMAKQQEIYNKMDREEGEMAEFLGGVYKAKFGATTGRNSAVTTDGYVYRSGDTFVTPKGIYTKTGNTYAGPGSFTTQTGTLFFGNESTTIQAGGAYFSEGKSGFIVSPNTSTWRTR